MPSSTSGRRPGAHEWPGEFLAPVKANTQGNYVSVDPMHLFRYLDEQCFRFNFRKLTDQERFLIVLSHVIGQRLTYAELTGKTGEVDTI